MTRPNGRPLQAAFDQPISLLDSDSQRSTTSRDDVLMDAAKRYRVDTEKLQKDVVKEFAANETRKQSRQRLQDGSAGIIEY
jgi:hypothetical protein